MQAIIRAHSLYLRSAAMDIAGRALLVRQLQWLRDLDVRRVVIGVDPRVPAAVLQRALRVDPALAAGAVWLADDGFEPHASFAQRGDLDPEGPILCVPGDIVGGADLRPYVSATEESCRLFLGRLPGAAAPEDETPGDGSAFVDVIRREPHPVRAESVPGWGARVGTAARALELATRALQGTLPPPGGPNVSTIQVHASQRAPGVWLARGAYAEPGAQLIGPVLLGPDSLVCRGATVGAGSVLSRASVVERGAVVLGSFVAEGMLLGERLIVRGQSVEDRSLVDLRSGRRSPLVDRLLLDRRVRPSFQALPASLWTASVPDEP